ncbi:lef11 [Hemileuca sp. nucleopolyhedrovirus]|uniref:Late expression factor 11 n=1 Tax=Hemileuca sp. nucleopolyhedrovirus TaxID=1367203 RepID=S5N354_9ABAC|nr:lef11 [Hemileuca sp. nucleopolyhedrovirus]AGR56780.1 lef11 [Hemileuca sp. nucleopolyhedrovirus]
MECSTSSEHSLGDASRIDENRECCLTRSEVYALLREVINKRKHFGLVDGVCDHVNSVGFQAQFEYIRKNIERVFVIDGDGRTQRKRLAQHISRLENLFKLNTSLEEEYRFRVTNPKKKDY